MKLWILSICSVLVLSAGASVLGWPFSDARSNTAPPPEDSLVRLRATGIETASRAAGPATCPVSDAVVTADPGQSPESPLRGGPLGTGPWFQSPDGKVWAPANKAGSPVWGMKQIWLKPVGSTLEVRGRRLDAEAPPMKASIPCCYPGDFQALGLIFPTNGCWEVEGRADGSILRFVVQVSGTPDFFVSESCESLHEAIWRSEMIIVGHVEETDGDPAKFFWQTARGREMLKTPGFPPGDPHPYDPATFRPTFGQVGPHEPVLQQGRSYLLFLAGRTQQLRCPRQTLAEVMFQENGARVVPLSGDSFSQASTLAEVASAIRMAAGSSSGPGEGHAER